MKERMNAITSKRQQGASDSNEHCGYSSAIYSTEGWSPRKALKGRR
jgi:hypothetical protein